MTVPMLASYADDYPHGKFYCVCLEGIDKDIDLKAQEAPLERADEGKAPFHRLDYPDNYFDVIVSGYSSFRSYINNQERPTHPYYSGMASFSFRAVPCPETRVLPKDLMYLISGDG